MDTISEIAEIKIYTHVYIYTYISLSISQHLVCNLDSISNLGISLPCAYSGDDYLMSRIRYIDGGTIYKEFNTKEDVLLKAARTGCHHLSHLLTWFTEPCKWVIVLALLCLAIHILEIIHPQLYAEILQSDSVNPPLSCTFPLFCSWWNLDSQHLPFLSSLPQYLTIRGTFFHMPCLSVTGKRTGERKKRRDSW